MHVSNSFWMKKIKETPKWQNKNDKEFHALSDCWWIVAERTKGRKKRNGKKGDDDGDAVN